MRKSNGQDCADRDYPLRAKTMIINSGLNHLLKPPPRMSEEWEVRLKTWLSIVLARPYQPVFKAQLEMVEAVVRLEEEMSRIEEERKQLLLNIPELKASGDNIQVRASQEKASELGIQKETLKYVRHCILLIGDTIAARILHVDAIKHFAAYPSPGFLSGKKGLAAELDAAKRFYAEKYMVVINDLTNCLRVGDLTLRKGEDVRTFEVKSNPEAYFTPEAARQIMIPRGIHEYIRTDALKGAIKVPGEKQFAEQIIRIASGTQEDWHDEIAGRLYRRLKKGETPSIQWGKKWYLASKRKDCDRLKEKISGLTQSGEWVVANVRRRVTDYPDIPPFTLWFRPDSGTEIMTGDVTVISAFAISDLAELFGRKGVRITWESRQEDLFPVQVSSDYLEQHSEFEFKGNVGDWHRLRVLYAFLALETFVEICAFLISPEALAKLRPKTDASG
ncbi:MAG: hypothetical protein ABSA41_14775 [Terriglobia bacterium]|jgi:hypothetical protein